MLHKVYYPSISKVTELRRFFPKLLGIQLSFCWMSIFLGFMFLIKPRRFIILENLLINIIKTTNLNGNQYLTIGCQHVHEHDTIRLSKWQRTSHYPVIKMSTNMALSGYQLVNEPPTIRLSKCPLTWHYPVIKMSSSLSLSGYQNVNEPLTIRLSKCQRTSHYPVIKMSTNMALSGYQHVNEQPTIRFSKCQRICTKIDKHENKWSLNIHLSCEDIV